MSSTNKTTYYELPQYTENDIFNPLADDNDAYEKIDTALHDIANAEAANAEDISGLTDRMSSAEGDIDALEAQSGSEVLTTIAQTLSGAVNELKSGENSLDNRLDVVENDLDNVTTGLKAKVSALETQNGTETLTTTAQTLSGAVNELDSDVTSVGNRTTQLESDINNPTTGIKVQLQEVGLRNNGSVNSLAAKKVILLTDSYGANPDASSKYIVDYFKEALGFTNDNVISSSLSSRGFTTTSLQAPATFKDMLMSITTTNDDAITDIIVLGGANDIAAANQSAIETAISEFVAYAKNRFENARILIACAGRHNHNATNLDKIDNMVLPAYCNCNKFGAIPIANFNQVLHNDDLQQSSDGLHPNSKGIKELGYKLAEGYLTGYVNVNYTVESVITSGDEAPWQVTQGNWVEHLKNGVCMAGIRQQGYIWAAAASDQALSGAINLGKVDSVLFGFGDFLEGQTVHLRMQDSGGTWHYGRGVIYKSLNDVMLNVNFMEIGTDVSLTDYRNLHIIALTSFSCPADAC